MRVTTKLGWVLGGALFASAIGCAQEQAPPARPLALSLKQAVTIAVSPEGSTAVQLAEEESQVAMARKREALSALLPSLSGETKVTGFTRSLAALGFTEITLPAGYSFSNLPFGIQIPQILGPVTSVDFRAEAATSVLNLSSIRRYQASQAGARASKLDTDKTKESIATQVAHEYMSALRAAADVEAVQANANLSQALVEQAGRVRDAGNGTGIDVTRAQVQLANDQQRLQAAESDLKQAKLSLLRTMHLSLDTDLNLTDKLDYVPVDPVTLADAKARAEKDRADMRAQKERQESARLGLSATRMQRLPTIAAYGDYGSTGNTNFTIRPTYTLGVSVQLPVYDGGLRRAQAAESSAQYREQSLRTRDLEDQVELEIRLALERLESAEQQLKVATAGLSLAETELEQANRRFAEGVTGSLEVTDSQTRLARARDNRIAALFGHNYARIDLLSALGSVIETIEK